MNKFYYFFIAAATLFILINLIGCKTLSNDKESNKNTFNHSANMESVTSIPDSVVQYLIHSAAKDFYDHQPPTVIDIRNVKAGFISSNNDTTYIICGEFLSKETKDWDSFETIKTYGYEQNIGNSFYCQKATFEKTDNNILSEALKSKLNQLRKSTAIIKEYPWITTKHFVFAILW